LSLVVGVGVAAIIARLVEVVEVLVVIRPMLH